MATRGLTSHFIVTNLINASYLLYTCRNNECVYEDVAVKHSIQKPTLSRSSDSFEASHQSASTLLNHPVKDALINMIMHCII